jgi:hypothetical protein
MADNLFPPLPRLLPSRSNEIQAGNSIRPFRVDWAGGWSGTRADFVAPSDGLKNSVPLPTHVDLPGVKSLACTWKLRARQVDEHRPIALITKDREAYPALRLLIMDGSSEPTFKQ